MRLSEAACRRRAACRRGSRTDGPWAMTAPRAVGGARPDGGARIVEGVRTGEVPRVVDPVLRAEAAEDVGPAVSAGEEYSESDVDHTGIQQSVDQQNAAVKNPRSLCQEIVRCDLWNLLRLYCSARGTPNVGGNTNAQLQKEPK